MNEDNLQRAVKKVISFGVFTLGILSILGGLFLIINSFVSNLPYLFEGGVMCGIGLILMYLVDQSILNTNRHDMLKKMIQENEIMAQRQRGSGGILGSILGGVGLGGTPVDIKIIKGGESDFFDELNLFGNSPIVSEDTNHPNFIKEVQSIMLKTTLNEEDAQAVVLLQGSTVEQMKKKREEFKQDDRFELVQFIDKMISAKIEENKKNDNNGNKSI